MNKYYDDELATKYGEYPFFDQFCTDIYNIVFRDALPPGANPDEYKGPEFERANRVIRRVVDLLETGDIAPVKRGKWIPDDDKSTPDLHMCSVCESISFRQEDNWGYDYSEELTPYCPYCGAKMDEEGTPDESI